MKKLISLLATAAFACGVYAQDFEGTITWTMRVEITDTAMGAQMADAQAQLASPEMQAQMKQAQEAMNSPEMQAMMKQNPQMRAMMERQTAAMPKAGATSGGPMENVFPKRFTLKARGSNTLVKVEGGMAPAEILTDGDKAVSYHLDRDAKTYRRAKVAALSPESSASPSFQITRTNDTAKVLGYTCRRYLVQQVKDEENATYSVWTTKDIKGLDAKKLNSLRLGRSQGPNFMSQLDGVPMKVEVTMAQAKLTMEVASIEPGALPAGTFKLPSEFTEVTQ